MFRLAVHAKAMLSSSEPSFCGLCALLEVAVLANPPQWVMGKLLVVVVFHAGTVYQRKEKKNGM